MVHGPCGAFNSLSLGMKEGNCSKTYPPQFIKETEFATNGYPLYRRRKPEDGGQTSTLKMNYDSVVIDNRWIVPYSPLLLKLFEAHINVECCDFRQTLPVIPSGTMADEIKACFKSSYLWKQISAEDWMSKYVAMQSGPTEAVKWLQTDSESITCSYHRSNYFNCAI
ncbi:hypothetical protein AVEN_30857-1 [Araneus ventricosus]|uniref:ATP-dependent DNA helicase n=1 Tax=Araneus ventricosus TaxID=182803 RepID=A0A4Y2QWD5_ARAVE|nr:hypothetical protein AVEN_30857-1 [Araneus ventricosus]